MNKEGGIIKASINLLGPRVFVLISSVVDCRGKKDSLEKVDQRYMYFTDQSQGLYLRTVNEK